MQAAERNNSFDILKTLAIFLVITYHFQKWDLNIFSGSINNYFHYFLQGTLGVHVPLFFLVNGALLMNRPFSESRHMRKTIRLFFTTLIHCVITLILIGAINDNMLNFDELVYQLRTWQNGWIQHLWFLQQLFIIYLIFFLIKPAFEHNKNAVKIFLVLYGILTIGNGTMTMIANLISVRNQGTLFSANVFNFFQNFHPFPSPRGGHLFYFLLGGFIASANKKIHSGNKVFTVSAIILVLSTCCVFAYGTHISLITDKIYNIVGNNYFSPFTAINVICVYILSIYFGEHVIRREGLLAKVILLVSKNTLGIYLVHFPVGKLFDRFISSYFRGNFLLTYTHSILLLAASLIIVLCVKKIPVIGKLYSL